MTATQELHDLGQSLWLDNITRGLLDDGTIGGYIDTHSVTGLTSNPSIFDNAIRPGPTTRRSRPHQTRASPTKRSSSTSRSRTCSERPTSSSPFTSALAGLTAGCRSRCRRFSPTTRRDRRSGNVDFATSRSDESLHQDPRHARGLPAIEESIASGIPST